MKTERIYSLVGLGLLVIGIILFYLPSMMVSSLATTGVAGTMTLNFLGFGFCMVGAFMLAFFI